MTILAYFNSVLSSGQKKIKKTKGDSNKGKKPKKGDQAESTRETPSTIPSEVDEDLDGEEWEEEDGEEWPMDDEMWDACDDDGEEQW